MRMASMPMLYTQRINKGEGDKVKVTKEMAIKEKITTGRVTKEMVLKLETKPNKEIKVTRSHISNQEETIINPGISIEEGFLHEETD